MISQNIAIIILSILGFGIFLAILVLVFIYGKVTVKDNPYKARIFIKTGNQVTSVNGTAKEVTAKGIRFQYRHGGIKIKNVLVPMKYGQDIIKGVLNSGKRLIFVDKVGRLIASPFDKDVELAPEERSNLIYEILESNVGEAVVREIKSKKQSIGLFAVIIALFLGALLGYGGVKVMERYQQQTNQPKQTQQQNQQQIPIEVK